VTKSFQHKTAVNDVSFSIGKGEVVAIFGPNRAGKTTTISMILGLLKPTGGQKRRLSFTLALAGDPELIIVDEPTVGMDITARNRFWQTVHQLSAVGKTIIFSTHYLQEADDAADRILLFKEGTIDADGTHEQIKARISTQSDSFIVDPERSLEKLYHLSRIFNLLFDEGSRDEAAHRLWDGASFFGDVPPALFFDGEKIVHLLAGAQRF
jgi:ABC-type multidrug transport system ATPase subunit